MRGMGTLKMNAALGKRRHELADGNELSFGHGSKERIRDGPEDTMQCLPNDKLEFVGATRAGWTRVEVHDDGVAATNRVQAVLQISPPLRNDRPDHR